MALIYPLKIIGFIEIPLGVLVMIWEFPALNWEKFDFPPLTSLIFRGFVYFLIAIPGFFTAPTTTGALAILVTGIVYGLAAYKGEVWCHPNDWGKKPSNKKGPSSGSLKPSGIQVNTISRQEKGLSRISPRSPGIDNFNSVPGLASPVSRVPGTPRRTNGDSSRFPAEHVSRVPRNIITSPNPNIGRQPMSARSPMSPARNLKMHSPTPNSRSLPRQRPEMGYSPSTNSRNYRR